VDTDTIYAGRHPLEEDIMPKQDDPFELNAPVKQALEQAHHALDTYFDYLKQSVSALPSSGTEVGETLKQDGVENLTAMQEVVKRLSQAGSLEEALRIQMAFVHSQLNVWGRQANDLASLYTKAAEDTAKERAGVKKS
jgi:hypothetical protein